MAETLPGPLVGLERDNEYALLVDKATQTLLLYQKRDGRLTHIKTYACSTGENDGKKSEPGDKRTPEGIYLFTSRKSGPDLPAEYGSMAFPLDYPNFYDRKQNKSGNGIWLHSTNEPLRAFLPQKTRGCIVVNDNDIQAVSQILRLRDTPIIIYEKIPYHPPQEQRKLRGEILRLVSSWEKSWETKDLNRFIGFYARTFRHDKMDLRAWRAYKRGIFSRTKRIHLKLTPYNILRHENYLIVTFRQDYRADTHSDKGVKRLFLIREKNTWRIVGEEWRKI